MNILFIGGTRFFGIEAVNDLIAKGHKVTIANRGVTKDSFANKVRRIILDRTNENSINTALKGKYFDTVIDNIAYSSNDIDKVLKAVQCNRYIYTSTMFVYENLHINTLENEFNGNNYPLVYSNRNDYTYDVTKRHAESLLSQKYANLDWTAVRFPYVTSANDYSERVLFYVENTINSKPMYVNNLEEKLGFIHCEEAGKFLSFIADSNFTGTVNASSYGNISVGEIIRYVESKTNSKALLVAENKGVTAPYNNTPEYSLNTDLAKELGFEFSHVNSWIFDLLDYYIDLVISKK